MSEMEDLLKAMLSDNKNEEQKDSDTSAENKENSTDNENNDDIFGGINIDMFMKIGEIMSKMSEQDKNTELLLALKPHLRDGKDRHRSKAIQAYLSAAVSQRQRSV